MRVRTRMERVVRIMLHVARSSDRLAALPLARELCTILGMSNASAMLRSVVQSAFSDAPSDRKLYKLVLDCDLDGALTQTGAAEALHISRRQFHRLRTQAVAAIAGRIEWILDANSTDALAGTKLMELRARTDAGELLTRDVLAIVDESEYAAALSLLAQSQFLHGAELREVDATTAEARRQLERGQGSFDEVAQFELEFLSFLVSRAHNDVASMCACAARLSHAGASRRALRERALAVNAETALRVGDSEAARALIADLRRAAMHAHDPHTLAIVNLLTAQEYALAGDYAGADEIAQAAALALERHRLESVWATTLLERIRSMTGRAWETSVPLQELEPRSLDYAALSVTLARYLLASGDAAAARAHAEPVCDAAQRAGFVGLTAAAMIVLGAAHDALGNDDDAQHCYAAGIREFAPVFDHIAASELFAIPHLPQRAFGPFARLEPIIEALVLRFAHLVPEVRDAKDSSWHDLFASMLLDDRPRKNVAGEIGSYRPAVMRTFELGAAPALPQTERETFLTTVEERISQNLKTAE